MTSTSSSTGPTSNERDLRRLTPVASSRFEATPLAHVLVYCLERKLTGSLVLSPERFPDGADVVRVVDGMPAKVRLREPAEQLGRIFVELGLIDDTTYGESLMEMARTRRLHGQVLLAMGKLDARGLRRGLETQVRRKVGALFTRPATTTFAYYGDVDLLASYGSTEVTPVAPAPLIWTGVRVNPSEVHIEAALSKMGAAPLSLRSGATVDDLDLTKSEREIVERVWHDGASLDGLVALGLDRPSATRRLIYALLLLKRIERRGGERSASQPRVHAPSGVQPIDASTAARRGADSYSSPSAITTRMRAVRVETPEVAPPRKLVVRTTVDEILDDAGSVTPPTPSEVRPSFSNLMNELLTNIAPSAQGRAKNGTRG